MRVASLLLVAATVASSGCDTLFPELFGTPAVDAGSSDMGDGGLTGAGLQGEVCFLQDVRDYRSCMTGVAPSGLYLTVEETRDQVTTDINGRFTLKLSLALTVATVAVVDPTGKYMPTIVPLKLVNGVATNLALPAVPAASVSAMAQEDDAILDTTKGTVLGWAIDGNGIPLTGVGSSNSVILVDGDTPNQLYPGSATGSRGAVAVVNALTPTLTLALTTPPTLAEAGDTFTLPVRAGAVTATTLVLPPRQATAGVN